MVYSTSTTRLQSDYHHDPPPHLKQTTMGVPTARLQDTPPTRPPQSHAYRSLIRARGRTLSAPTTGTRKSVSMRAKAVSIGSRITLPLPLRVDKRAILSAPFARPDKDYAITSERARARLLRAREEASEETCERNSRHCGNVAPSCDATKTAW